MSIVPRVAYNEGMVDYKKLLGRRRRRGNTGKKTRDKQGKVVGVGKKVRSWFSKLARAMLRLVLGVAVVGLAIGLVAGWWWWRGGTWNGVNRVNVLVGDRETGEVRLYSYQGGALGGMDAVVVNLGRDVLVDVAHGYGGYRLGVLPELGRQEGYGSKLLAETVEIWLGVKVTGVIEVAKLASVDSGRQQWQQFRSVLWTVGDNSVPVGDRWQLWWQSRGLSSSQMVNFDLIEGAVYEPKTLPDRTVVYNVRENKLDVLVNSYLADGLVRQRSEVGVAVVNTTGRKGLAKRVARMLTNTGYDVVGISDSDEVLEDSKVLAEGQVMADKPFLYPAEEMMGVEAQEAPLVGKYRAWVVVMLGKDMEKRFYER